VLRPVPASAEEVARCASIPKAGKDSGRSGRTVTVSACDHLSSRAAAPSIEIELQVLDHTRIEAEFNELIALLDVSVDRSTRLVGQLITVARLDPQQH
jgi:hypothetical protein